MEIFTQNVPAWVSLLFLAVITIPTFMIASLARKGEAKSENLNGSRVYWVIVGFYILYLIYVAVACLNGLFAKVSLPPTILKFTMVPLLLFLLLVIFNLPTYKTILRNSSLSDLVRLHIFRLIGSFFIILGLYKALPSSIAFIAGTGDVITALTSLFVAKAIDENKSYARPLTYAWNTFGLIDILATSAMAFMLTKLSIETGSQGVDTLGEFPFCFIPAFAPATIIFLHLSVYRKLRWSKK